MVAGEESMRKAKPKELVTEVEVNQLHDENVQTLELAMVTGEDSM